MTLLLISLVLISMALSILFAEAPLTLGLWLILITLFSCTAMATITTKWFAIVLFLIYVGGLLVMFSYFSAISPNQLTDISTIISTATFSIALISSIITPKFYPSLYTIAETRKSITPETILSPNNLIPLTAAALILFLAIVVVIKIAPKHQGPLRPFN